MRRYEPGGAAADAGAFSDGRARQVAARQAVWPLLAAGCLGLRSSACHVGVAAKDGRSRPPGDPSDLVNMHEIQLTWALRPIGTPARGIEKSSSQGTHEREPAARPLAFASLSPRRRAVACDDVARVLTGNRDGRPTFCTASPNSQYDHALSSTGKYVVRGPMGSGRARPSTWLRFLVLDAGDVRNFGSGY